MVGIAILRYMGNLDLLYMYISKIKNSNFRTFTSLCVNLTLFGITAVYVILSSSIFHKVLIYLGIKIHFCLLLIILTILILPITFLRSPADFWFVQKIIFFFFEFHKMICSKKCRYSPLPSNLIL